MSKTTSFNSTGPPNAKVIEPANTLAADNPTPAIADDIVLD